MFVGLKRFLIIWLSVDRSTPGNSSSTESIVADTLSSWVGGEWYVPWMLSTPVASG